MRLTSSVIDDGGTVPERYTCDGPDVSPPLSISGVPEGTRELVLVVDDPDAPDGTFVHWTIWDLDPAMEDIPEGASGHMTSREGRNGFGENGWRGPCPPEGEHRYRFTLYAVGARLEVPQGAERDELEAAMEGHVVDEARLVATYGR